MSETQRIDLAHEAEFRIGRITVRPPLRQLVRDDGEEEVVEPRVMQVLIALAQAGGVVSRDELGARCWEGRIVGDDAINRVISRLRRSAQGIGEGSFRIETLTKVGYRLVRLEQDADAAQDVMPDAKEEQTRRLPLARRAMLAGGGLAVIGVGGFAAWRHFAPASDAPPADVAPLLEQARLVGRQGNADGYMQAVSLLRRVTQMRPDYANGWGLLAMHYAGAAGRMSPEMEPTMRTRAGEAAGRALKLDPGNAYARFALATLDPSPGNWRRDEVLARDVLAGDERDAIAWAWLAGVLTSVGRCREGADDFERVHALGQTDPSTSYARIVALWSAGRLDAADKAAAEAADLYPTQYAVWFTRFYLLLYTDRAADALVMSHNTQLRPAGYSDDNFAMIEQVAQAMLTRAPKDVEAAVAASLDWAHRGAGFAENGVQFCAALGDVDTAFRIADAYFFGRGFKTGENRFEPDQRLYTRQQAQARHTRFLFFPSTMAMRRDPRFEKLVRELGLARYWQQSGTLPDYRNA